MRRRTINHPVSEGIIFPAASRVGSQVLRAAASMTAGWRRLGCYPRFAWRWSHFVHKLIQEAPEGDRDRRISDAGSWRRSTLKTANTGTPVIHPLLHSKLEI